MAAAGKACAHAAAGVRTSWGAGVGGFTASDAMGAESAPVRLRAGERGVSAAAEPMAELGRIGSVGRLARV